MFRNPEPDARDGHPQPCDSWRPQHGPAGALGVLLWLCCMEPGLCQVAVSSLQFFREDLTFTLEADPESTSRPLGVILGVDGIYSFRNTAGREQTVQILYPFPADSHCGAVADARVRSLPSGQEIPITHQDSLGIRFPLALPAQSEQLLRIQYRQQMPHGVLHYILTTTQAWGEPLESATFTLDLADTLRLDSLSYPATGQRALEHSTLYYWQFEEFMPQWDWVIRYSRIGAP